MSGMQRIDCAQCGTGVLVAKYSAQHTGVQWLSDASADCTLARAGEVRPPGLLDGTAGSLCPALHSTIDAAARSGELPITRRVEPVPGTIG